MNFRSATNADGPEVRALVFSVLGEYGLSGDPAGTDADLDDIAARYLARGGWFELVEDEGALLGCAGIYPSEHRPGTVELRKMYLKKAARGRGLGRQLMERAIGFARGGGWSRIELETNGKLIEAISLYRRYGFKVDESGEPCSRCDQVMALELRPEK
jgi:putative acetyltransferase